VADARKVVSTGHRKAARAGGKSASRTRKIRAQLEQPHPDERTVQSRDRKAQQDERVVRGALQGGSEENDAHALIILIEPQPIIYPRGGQRTNQTDAQQRKL